MIKASMTKASKTPPCANPSQYSLRGALSFLFALLVLVVSLSAHAQVLTGEVDGNVLDSTGASIPNAEVTVTNTDQNLVVRTLKTNSKGQFTAPLLTVGTYKGIVAAPGFKGETVTGLDVHVGQPTTVPAVLSPGAVSEEVSVTASDVAPQLESAAAGTLINTEQVTDLPLSSRNYLQLLTIQPGISGGIPAATSAAISLQAVQSTRKTSL